MKAPNIVAVARVSAALARNSSFKKVSFKKIII